MKPMEQCFHYTVVFIMLYKVISPFKLSLALFTKLYKVLLLYKSK